MYRNTISSSAAGVLALIVATQASAQSTGGSSGNAVAPSPTQASPAAPASAKAPAFDYQNTPAAPLPQANRAPPTGLDAEREAVNPSAIFGSPGFSPGAAGSGQTNPIQLAPAKTILPSSGEGGLAPEEFGTAGLPYTTSQANASGDQTSKFWPYRAAGKLYFQIGTANYVCSASLIKRGIVVTAAHCVANFGKSAFYHNWEFVPAYNNGSAPYGTFTASSARIMTSYYNGTDSCAQPGVICQDDVAVLTMNKNSAGQYPGTYTGWYGYGWNGYSYTGGKAQITQLGYPVALDGGLLMERNDAQGATTSGYSNNTYLGSLMTGGSSGGPWLVNFGNAPALNGTGFGTAAAHNTVVGVTSWGWVSTTVKAQGAAPFTSSNIVVLVNASCAATPAACQ